MPKSIKIFFFRLKTIVVLSFILSCANGQNTVGLLQWDPQESLHGYNLLYPENQTDIYLIDNCGRIINQWEDELSAPGKVAHLLKDGTVLRAKSKPLLFNSATFGTGGAGGIIEILSWENEVNWRFVLADSLVRQHHDILMMPNGNVLAIVWERRHYEELIENGFDTLNRTQEEVWPDFIVEIDTTRDSIVWEWHAWDHMIQDFDPTKRNYGNVAEHPELIDINYHEYTFERQDWMHSNSIDYNEALDQIMISVRNFHEIWIIDHSTTTVEAASHSGGNSNRGGDLLFRWGNPEAYKKGTKEDRKLFYQHDAQWVDEVVDESHPYYGKIILYNNAIANGLSLGQLLSPKWNASTQSYEKMNDGTFLPASFDRAFSHPDTAKNYSTAASSIQLLRNGNILMCAARQGRSFELSQEGIPVWEYLTPMVKGVAIPQGYELSLSDNFTFQMRRYAWDYEGLDGLDLTPGDYIELDPNTDLCDELTDIDPDTEKESLTFYPNPCFDELFIEKLDKSTSVFIIDLEGRVVETKKITETTEKIDVSGYPAGLYFIKTDGHPTQRFIKF